MRMSRLEVRDLTIEYVSEGYVVRPVAGLDLRADDGEIVLLVGPSGSGKTSVLSCLGGILTPAAGSIRVSGRELVGASPAQLVEHRRSGVGIVFQAFNLVPSLSARENVAVPLLLAGQPRSAGLRRADELLASVGLAQRARHRPGQLSGGQQQRVAIARGLVHDPPVLLADEPTANLDHVQAEAVVGLLRGLRDRGRTIVISTHDQRLVPVADRLVTMIDEPAVGDEVSQRVAFAPGETVFAQGATAELVYVIDAGRVEIVRELAGGAEERLTVLDPGTYFGELGALLGFPRSATARALTEVELTALSPARFRAWLQDQPVRPRPGGRLPDASVTVR